MSDIKVSENKSITAFFVLVLIITLPFYILCGLAANNIIFPQEMALIFAVSIVIAPFTAAMILTYKEKGSDDAKELLKSSLDPKIPKKIWYVPVFLLLPAVWILAFGLLILTGVPIPDPQFPLIVLVFFTPIFLVTATCEEVGWQGYVYDEMENKWDALKASLILGFIWAIWHVPAWIFTVNRFSILPLSINLLAWRILIIWIYNNTGKRVFPTILFHVIIDLGTFMLPIFILPLGFMISGIVALIVSIFVVFLWGPETLTQFRKKE